MRVQALALVLLSVSGCGGKSAATGGTGTGGGGGGGGGGEVDVAEPAGPPLPAPPDGFRQAAMVSIGVGTVTAWGLAGSGADEKVERLGSAQLADLEPDDFFAHLRGEWADFDHLAVLMPPRDVIVISAERVRRVAVPPASAFATPRPQTDDDGLEEGGVMTEDGMGLITDGGAAWWVECPWGYPYDGWQCEQYVHAQLWPKAGKVEPGEVEQARWAWPTAAPAGYKLKELDEGRALGCTPPPGTKQKQSQLRAVEEDGELVQEHHWVSVSPPRLLVVFGTPGLDDLSPVRWTLHDGCLDRPLAQGTVVEPGPDGLWLAWESPDPRADEVQQRRNLWRGARALGELPIDAGEVAFRPPVGGK